MVYNNGTATDYVDLLNDLIDVVTSNHLDAVAINAGGTGHAVGDIIDIDATGSTSTHVAKVEVTAVSAGVITGVRVYRGGAYTVNPTTLTGNAQSATTGSGTGATFDLTMATSGWTQTARQQIAASATVSAGGSGYAVSDTLTLVGGVLAPGGSPATFTVATLSGSAVATVTLATAGDYEVPPTNAAATTNDGAGDNLCTLNVTYSDKTGDTIVVLTGDAGVEKDPIIGIKAYSTENDETGLNTVYNWALFGMTAYSSTQALHQQANVSDGFSVLADGTLTTSTTGDGAFVPLKTSDAFNIDYWIRHTGRSVTMVARVEGASTVHYAWASFGLLNQIGVSSEYDYPLYVAGSSDRKKVWYRDTLSVFGGLAEVISRNNGPMFVWTPDGMWVEAKNAGIAANQTTTVTYDESNNSPRVNVWPLGRSQPHATASDDIWDAAPASGFDQSDITLSSGAVEIWRTPDTAGDIFPLYPVSIIQADSAGPDYRAFGEIDGVFWFHIADSAASSEDEIKQGSDRYLIAQSGTRVEKWSHAVLKQD